MSAPRFMLVVAIALSSCLHMASVPVAADELAAAFHNPPASARPWVYWFWLNGYITREGITADLEAMQRVGIGGVLIMEVDQGTPSRPGGVHGSEVVRAVQIRRGRRRGRLGLEVNMNDDAGWNGSGGPWIKPEQSMHGVVWSETRLEGGRRFEGPLPQPPTVGAPDRDIAVLAMPTPRSELAKMQDASPRLTSSAQSGELRLPITLPLPEPNKPPYARSSFRSRIRPPRSKFRSTIRRGFAI